ncbi:MAG: hypothetical protein KGL15_05470 [Acidobacteriota bacterium]|nr:hypothetical protein [Acidobacteriota bacterium]
MSAVLVCGLAITACGSADKTSSTRSASYEHAIKYSDCMRSQGVSNFPDPATGGGFDMRALGATVLSSPTFASALKACAKLQPGGSGPPPITSHQIFEMTAKASCIRRHGFSNFPDPSLSGNGMMPPSNWNPESPASIRARKACADVGIPIPGWGAAWFGSPS